MKTLYSEKDLTLLEHDPASKVFVITWQSYRGPHFRRAIEAMLTQIRSSGVVAYISNAAATKDVPDQADFEWVESTVKPALLKGGLKRFITVLPASAIAKMTTSRFGKLASSAGVDTYQVKTLQEGLEAAAGKLAA